MNTEQLKTFLSLVETKNFSRSAENLILSQSTISKRIFELEKEIDQKLFVRDRRGVTLTRAGKTFLEYAEQIVNMEEKALIQLKQTSEYSGYLIIGTAYAYYDMHLYKHIQQFSALHPDISVRVKVGHMGPILNELKRALIDIAFMHHAFYNQEYICKCVGEDELVLVTDAKNTTFEDGILLSEIRNLPLIDTNFLYGPTRQRLFPSPHQFQLTLDVAACAIPLLSGSKWYAILAQKQVEQQLASAELREIPICDGELPPVEHYIVYRKEIEQQTTVSNFLSIM